MGRLIRTTGDHGRVVILDSRLVSKAYGKRFIAALPHGKVRVFDKSAMADVLTQYR